MGKDDVGPVTELGTLVGRFAGEEAQRQIMAGSEGIADATEGEVAAWLKGAVGKLDALLDEGTRTQILENMGFNCAEMNRSHIEQALAKRQRFETLDAFLEAEEKNPSRGTRLVREGDVVYQYFDPRSTFKVRCFCSLWRGLPDDEDASLTWCHCSKAFVTKLWEAYLGELPQVELLASCIAGAPECKFAVRLPG
jgi:hypothetical protein